MDCLDIGKEIEIIQTFSGMFHHYIGSETVLKSMIAEIEKDAFQIGLSIASVIYFVDESVKLGVRLAIDITEQIQKSEKDAV